VTGRSEVRLALAGPLRRIVACLLDGVIVVVISLSIVSMFFGGPDEDIRSAKSFFVPVMTWGVYSILLISAYQATPGMMAAAIHVANRDGSRAMPDAVVLRYLGFMAVTLPGSLVLEMGTNVQLALWGVSMLLLAVNFLLLFADPGRRLIHDRVSGTVVLAGRPEIEEP
jgi:uncharacterized RDD family membrane protein YckC